MNTNRWKKKNHSYKNKYWYTSWGPPKLLIILNYYINYLFRLVLIRADENMSRLYGAGVQFVEWEEINRGSSYFACWSMNSNEKNETKKKWIWIGICNFKWIASPFQSIELKIESCENRWMHVIFCHCFCHHINTIEFIISDSIINTNYNFIIHFIYLYVNGEKFPSDFRWQSYFPTLICALCNINCADIYSNETETLLVLVLRLGNYFGFIISKQN